MKKLFFVLTLGLLLVGIVSADTMIIYPTDEGNTWRQGTNLAWADIRDGIGTNIAAGTDYSDFYLGSGTTAWTEMDRTLLSFNLSTLSGKTITAVNLTLIASTTKTNTFTDTPDGVITNASPSSWTLLAKGDYNKTGTVLMGNYTYAGWNNTNMSANNVSFTSSGVSYFNARAGTNATIALRTSWDYDNSPHYTASKAFQLRAYGVGHLPTTVRPFITVTYTTETAPVASFTTAKSLYRIPGILQVNDTSTNTPTQWNWSWGDGTWTNGTTQNATHKFTTRGMFSVNLLCSNAGGSNTTPTASTVRVVGYANV